MLPTLLRRQHQHDQPPFHALQQCSSGTSGARKQSIKSCYLHVQVLLSERIPSLAQQEPQQEREQGQEPCKVSAARTPISRSGLGFVAVPLLCLLLKITADMQRSQCALFCGKHA